MRVMDNKNIDAVAKNSGSRKVVQDENVSPEMTNTLTKAEGDDE